MPSNDLRESLAKRDALFRNPTLDAAMAHYGPLAPLAMAHKARLQWLDATDPMLAESRAWLKENGYEATLRGGAPLTPASRDVQRIQRGMPPLSPARKEADA